MSNGMWSLAAQNIFCGVNSSFLLYGLTYKDNNIMIAAAVSSRMKEPAVWFFYPLVLIGIVFAMVSE